ncbi:unnamed protein product [Lactuca virosa]|uniref:mitogen-activated protein kinase n=1 Tax=Lactuca virosa TaxID=75947 RepID=A0AAU9PHH6_9ASTR|nr:unnamed protein product [Lactuca virosa]
MAEQLLQIRTSTSTCSSSRVMIAATGDGKESQPSTSSSSSSSIHLTQACRHFQKRALDKSIEEGLATWVQDSIKGGKLKDIIDSDIRGEISTKCLKVFVRIAKRCLLSHPKQRPTMAEVVFSLESALTLQVKINSSLQAGGKTIFGRMFDRFPFSSSLENSANINPRSSFGEGSSGKVDNNTLISTNPDVSIRKHKEEGFQGHTDTSSLGSTEAEFFSEYGEGSRYKLLEVIGKGSSGIVCSAYDTHIGEKVAIKKINDIFEHVSVAVSIIREIKLLRLLCHSDIVEIKHILLPPSRREFKDIYLVFELMGSDLHEVIKGNDDLTPEHHQFFLYQLLRGLKYIHSANVFHRDLKPKNILANADCKLKICDFGLSRVAFNHPPTAIYWTDYVAARWYRAPELCGLFFSKYTPAIDIWSIGCIFAEILTGKPLFPGKNTVHQLDLMTDLLGTPSPETISKIGNEKARRYLSCMRKKNGIPFSHKFPNKDPLALRLLERMLAFEHKDRPTTEEALSDPYFKNIAKTEKEPSAQPISKLEFEFERRKYTEEDVRELIYREILEYHPNMLKEYLDGAQQIGFNYPSAVKQFKKQFAYLEEHYGNSTVADTVERPRASSLPRACILHPE